MISCFGSGDSKQFDLLHNQRYQTFETIPLFTQKMMGQPIRHRNRTQTSAKNHRQRRPTMEINAVQGNRPRFKLKIKKMRVLNFSEVWKMYLRKWLYLTTVTPCNFYAFFVLQSFLKARGLSIFRYRLKREKPSKDPSLIFHSIKWV